MRKIFETGDNGRGKARDRYRRALCGAAFFAGAIYIALGGFAQARNVAGGDAAQFVARVGQEVIDVLGRRNRRPISGGGISGPFSIGRSI